MTTQTQTTDFSAFDAGSDLKEQQLEAAGFRRLQHMNENTTYHRGSVIERGGYAIKDENGDAPDLGKIESIKHFGGGSTLMRVATEVELAVIGFSNKYYVAEFDDPAGTLDSFGKLKRVRNIVDHYIYPADLPGANGKCSSCISLFVVLQKDARRELYELTFKSFNTDEGVKLINALKGYAGAVAQELAKQRNKTTKLHTFALWLTLGVGETQMKGKAVQGPSTPPVWKVDPATPALMQRLVSGEDYRTFIELRKELDAYLAQGRYSGNGAPALNGTEARPALPAGQQVVNAGSANGSGNGDINF